MGNDDDIGRCDDCGSEDDPREEWRRFVSVDGDHQVIRVWLCPACVSGRPTR